MCAVLYVALSAMPVTMPGRAIGSSSTNDTVSRPKKRNRWTANAASEPSRIAMSVAPAAACSESRSASRMSGFVTASAYQWVVQSVIGQVWLRSALKL